MIALLANKWAMRAAIVVAVIALAAVLLHWNNERVRDRLLEKIKTDINASTEEQRDTDDEIEREINSLDDDSLLDLWLRQAFGSD